MALAILIYFTVTTVLGTGATVMSIGKQRKPVTNGLAAATTFIAATYVAAYAYLASQLG